MGKKSREKRERRGKIEDQSMESSQEYFDSEAIATNRTVLESICLFIIRWSVYLMLFIPLLVDGHSFFPYVGPKGLYLMGLIEIAFFFWIVLIFHSPKYRPKINVLLLSLSAFVIILTLASIFGADPSRSFWSKFERMSGLLMWFHLFGLFLVLSTTFKNQRAWLRAFALSVGVAVFICLMFFMDKAGLGKLPVAKNGATLGNSSFLATYLLFNLCFAIYIFLTINRKKELKIWSFARAKYPCLIVLAIATSAMGAALIMSGGSAATLAFFGAMGLMAIFWLALEVKKKSFRIIGKAVLVVSIIVFLISIILLFMPNSIVQQKLVETRSNARPLLWQIGFNAFLERPILGWGPQNFSFVFDQRFDPCFYLPECGTEVRFDQAHNIIVDNLVDAGILGLLSYFSFLFFACYILWKDYIQKRLGFWAPAVFTSLLVAHFVQNLTVFDMPASFLMLFLVLGFSGAVAQPLLSKDDQRKRGSGVFLVVAIIIFLFTFSSFVYKPSKVSFGLINVMMADTQAKKEVAYEQVFNSSPIGKYQARTHLAGELTKNAEQGSRYFLGEFDIIIRELEKSIESSPLDYFSHLALGKVYNSYGTITGGDSIVKAEKVLERALELSPFKQAGYWELARSKVLLGKYDECIALVEKSVELEPMLDYSHIYLVNIAKIIDDIDLAIEKAKEAVEILPDLRPRLEEILGIEDLGVDK